MSIRLVPPPAPDSKRRSCKQQFAQVEFCSPTKVFEVHIEELSVGGAMVEFLGVPPPGRMTGLEVNVFIDVGFDEAGKRVAGTVKAEIIYIQPANKRGPARALLMWSGPNPAATQVIHRLLSQQANDAQDAGYKRVA